MPYDIIKVDPIYPRFLALIFGGISKLVKYAWMIEQSRILGIMPFIMPLII